MAAPMSKRVFPWVSREEWEEVYYGLYTDYGSDASSSSAVAKQWAIERTQLWRSRSGNRFPPGVETTVCLAQALLLLLEEERERSKTRERCDEVRLLLSMAIVRFVNFVADVGQKNTFRAQPVHVLAGMKGVPEWVVDLRHTATHATLPSLSILVLGAEFALTWLQNQYWEVERARLSPSPINSQTSAGEACVIKKGKKEEEEEEGEEEREERIRSLLGDYQQLQFETYS
ncbi:PREDICTED: ribosomal biogenesis protein LAS1L-like [Priapulus caudatus]|uniref:Ribosomal biogenesis protein LAS1L-like n=1 Tax=Priapulus caudatus TaxID=37621 RepID=A0ABM1EYD9_PRICU|nr:PREDICTED: ribosomal biogenesis protein LAS1L-like [Priapulus caudatus]